MSDGGPSRPIVLRDERLVVTIGANGMGHVVGGAFTSAAAKVHITDIGAALGVRARFDELNVLVSNVGVADSTRLISVDGHVECL